MIMRLNLSFKFSCNLPPIIVTSIEAQENAKWHGLLSYNYIHLDILLQVYYAISITSMDRRFE